MFVTGIADANLVSLKVAGPICVSLRWPGSNLIIRKETRHFVKKKAVDLSC